MDNKNTLRAKRRNLIVSINGLKDPYILGGDNAITRWSNADVGKLYAFKCVTIPLDLRLGDSPYEYSGVQATKERSALQEHIRLELYNVLATIEFYRKPRDVAVKEFVGPYKIIDSNPEEAERFLRTMGRRYPMLPVDELIQATLTTTTKEQNPDLMETIGTAVRIGAEDFIRLKKLNGVGKRMPWKVHREYDLILYHLIRNLDSQGFIEADKGLEQRMLEELSKDRYIPLTSKETPITGDHNDR